MPRKAYETTPDRDLELAEHFAKQPARNDAVSREIFKRFDLVIKDVSRGFYNLTKEDREDACSDAKLKVFKALSERSFKGGNRLEDWYTTIVKNCFTDTYNKRKLIKKREYPIDDNYDDAPYEWLTENHLSNQGYQFSGDVRVSESEIESDLIVEHSKQTLHLVLHRIAAKDDLEGTVASVLIQHELDNFFKQSGLFDLAGLYKYIKIHSPESVDRYRNPYQEVRRALLSVFQVLRSEFEPIFHDCR